MPTPVPLRIRFKAKIGPRLPNGCIVWLGSFNTNGYGQIGRGRRGTGNALATRLAYEYARGPITSGLFVLHSCDNPWCINPRHLFLGTQADNMKDMARKRRSLIGEKNRTAKLTYEDVVAIRRTNAPQKYLARRYGVTIATISKIKNRKVWNKRERIK